ncbi:hypothetical protein [Salirhabdus salicampi]|uniref:hypothetical protein n=1 Tax=Salirhabdus salicampi TaxID=476102 RepID=UPI0020C5A872|nr:hypothetical protein [Salirhabdus salicampi]MCP8617655.1 hypothetical protein [Salirhabdus salicampi]
MPEQMRQYRTGQGVPKKGKYICQSGRRVELRENETFPYCPVSKEETSWVHEEDV